MTSPTTFGLIPVIRIVGWMLDQVSSLACGQTS
jgi:hypothetical protein